MTRSGTEADPIGKMSDIDCSRKRVGGNADRKMCVVRQHHSWQGAIAPLHPMVGMRTFVRRHEYMRQRAFKTYCARG